MSLKVLSYNLWFDQKNSIERLESLLVTILTLSPDVLCFQEVTPNIFSILKSNLVEYKNIFPKNIDSSYDCLIMSKYEILKSTQIPFENSIMGRKLLITVINYSNEKVSKSTQITIVTSHFESMFKEKINQVKIDQFALTIAQLNKLYNKFKSVILCSDTNILENEESFFFNSDIDWNDAWVKDGMKEDKKYTYDSNTNKNLYGRKIGGYQSRIDRIIYRADNLILKSFSLIKGTEGLIQPSDHHGVFSEFIVNI
ncbi:MAG: endonuclease/exonuclease/phosphatase family protein [Edafosvirus sp.]|uniref:Endonuclease/exonuclease/phosphatase family protein n=1 Tax=Edafosvirus sp. TaxID=2487765 RepID=A0A3G4ZYE6_9VIRU|nr:MAG: endonuclease/exonuclease/phosphatase family protein [Edafosvirus sp.]